MFLRADSTSQPTAAGSHQAAGTTYTHTHTQRTHAHTDVCNFHGNQ